MVLVTVSWWSVYSALALVVTSSLLGCNLIQPRSASPALSERGERLYNAHCLSCHGGATGGRMMDIPPPHNANGHTWHHPDCQLKRTILDGSGEMGEMMRRMVSEEDAPRMPAFRGQLSEEDVEAILAYIKTWWTPQQQEIQARVTQHTC